MSNEISYRIKEGEHGDVLIIYQNADINDVIFRFEAHAEHGYGSISDFKEITPEAPQ